MRTSLWLLALLGLACGAAETEPASVPAVDSLAERFSEERAWSHLQNLVAMGPRAPGSPGHGRARIYLRKQLEALGAAVEEMRFRYRANHENAPRPFTNISGLIGTREEGWVLLGAHYDTRLWADLDPDPAQRSLPILGANDGGSGVAVLLEVARVVSEAEPGRGLEVVFFDGEDFGRAGETEDYLVGSRHLAANWETLRPGPRPDAVVIVDMVGDADLEIFQERSGARAAPELTQKLFASAARVGGGAFVPRIGQAILDDHTPFLRAGFPAAVLIDLDYPAWHTQADTLDKCAPRSLGIVGRVVLETFYGREPFRGTGSRR
ncbi:MAG: M28 family peptidase [Myxococcales bacterium]|nr:M28 family peptidase [Myxococcales bacterium]